MLWFQRYKPKSTFYPYVLFLAMAAILVGWQGHRTHFLNKIPQWWLWQSFIKFSPVVSEEKIFVKVYGHQMVDTKWYIGEDFCKSLRTPDAGCQVMKKAHLALWARWAKNEVKVKEKIPDWHEHPKIFSCTKYSWPIAYSHYS